MTGELFQVAEVIALAGWVLGVAEYISTLLMLSWSFRFGLPVWRQEITASNVEVPADTANAVVRRVTDSEWVFRSRVRFFEFQSPFPIRGTVSRSAQGMTVVGRQPLGGALFLLGFAVIMGLPAGPLLAAAMYLLSWVVERPRFDRAWQELSKDFGVRRLP